MNASTGNRDRGGASYAGPARLLAVIAATVFVGEVIVMLIFAVLPPFPTLTEALLDGLMITAITTPPLLLFLFRPMVHQIEQRKLAEEQLQRLNDQLEGLVDERTRELTTAIEQLRREMADRITAETGLSKSTDFIHRVLAAAPCLLIIYDVNTLQCSYVNERVSDLLGYSTDDVVVKGSGFFEDVFSGDDLARFRELNTRIAAGIVDGITTCECTLQIDQAGPRRFNFGFVPMAGAGGKKDVLMAAVPATVGWQDTVESVEDIGR